MLSFCYFLCYFLLQWMDFLIYIKETEFNHRLAHHCQLLCKAMSLSYTCIKKKCDKNNENYYLSKNIPNALIRLIVNDDTILNFFLFSNLFPVFITNEFNGWIEHTERKFQHLGNICLFASTSLDISWNYSTKYLVWKTLFKRLLPEDFSCMCFELCKNILYVIELI